MQTSKLSLARALVELVQDAGSIRQSFGIEHQGADWEGVVRIRSTEDGDPPSSLNTEVGLKRIPMKSWPKMNSNLSA